MEMPTSRRAWERPMLAYEGDVDEIVLSDGKVTPPPGDPGEALKTPGLG